MAMSPLEEICKNNHACNADLPLQYALAMLLHTTDRQTDRQNAELCRNISCLAEFRQNWVKPETDSIFGNTAILWPPQLW